MKLSKWLKRLSSAGFLLLWLPFAMIMVTGPLAIALWGPDNQPGSYFWSMTPWVILTVALGLMSVVFFIGSLLVGGASNLWIMGSGRDAEATILSTRDTGSRVNDNPVVDFSLRVQPPDLPAFVANARKTVSIIDLPLYQPGKTIEVRYIPGKEHVAIVDANDRAMLTAQEARRRS